MGLFSESYREPSDREAFENRLPRKGVRGFCETLGDYLLELFKANLVLAVCLLPAVLLYYVSVKLTGNIVLVSLIAMLGAFPAGAALTALFKVVYESIRNRGFSFWKAFCRAFSENKVRGILPGALYILSWEGTVYLLLFSEAISLLPNPKLMRIMIVLMVLAIRMLLGYMLPMMSLVELPMRHYVRNSLILMVARPKATIGSAVCTAVLYVLTVLFFPGTSAYVLLLAFSFHALVSGMWCWPALNETLKIEEREGKGTGSFTEEQK